MKEPLELTEKERDILFSLLLKEIRDVDNYNAVVQAHLKSYKEDLHQIYKKIVANMDEE
jgi:proline dehydrogenase